mgnify:FL=1
MKRMFKVLAVVFCSLVLVGSAQAYNGNTADIEQQIGVFGAYQNTDDLDEGYGGGLRYAVFGNMAEPGSASPLESIDIGGDLRASWLAGYEADGNDFETDIYPVQANLLVRPEFKNGLRPYAGGGIGYAWFDEDNGNTNYELDDEWTYSVLLGIDQEINEQFSMFVEGEYMWLQPDIENDSGEADLDGFGVNVGVNYNF